MGIDLAKSSGAFDMKEIDVEVQVIEENLGKFAPKVTRAKFLIFICLFILFFISWKLTLFGIAIQLFIKFISMCLNERTKIRYRMVWDAKRNLFNNISQSYMN